MKKIDIFVNPIDKKINNNKNISFDRLSKEENVLDKINDIFKDEDKIYRVNCEITFKDYKRNYLIIGKTTNSLITIQKNIINISDIVDIKKI